MTSWKSFGNFARGARTRVDFMALLKVKKGMADKDKKWPDNEGKGFFVDEECIDCDACRSEAPNNFKRNDDHGYSFVYKQPESDEEKEQCQAALEACPVEAIGIEE